MDEIVVELTSSFVIAALGIADAPRAEHAAYVASRLDVLKGDSCAISLAACRAQTAADWMPPKCPRFRDRPRYRREIERHRATSSHRNTSPRRSTAAPFPSAFGQGRLLR